MMRSRKAVLFCIILSSWTSTEVLAKVNQAEQDCQSRNTQCNICIQGSFCHWCSHPKVITNTSVTQRCFPVTTTDTCTEAYINPVNDIKHLEEEPLTEVDANEKKSSTANNPHKKIIQLYPQKVHLKLRKGIPQNITITFRQAKDFPLDIYFLIDFSKTMSDYKSTLADMGTDLINTIRNMTSRVKIGFGSFIDKVLPPIVDGHFQNLIKSPDRNTVPPYSFRNNLKLTKDSKLFQETLKNAKFSTNMDRQEGGLDALMQAMVCKDEINWGVKGEIRRLLVYSTDSTFHHAGEGRIAGVTRPHDGKCHMIDGNYTDYDVFDYPSIGQINKAAKAEQMNIIFAVTNKVFDLHEKLSKRIEGSFCAKLSTDSRNIIEIVKKQYEDITSYIKMTDDGGKKVKIKYFSSCLDPNGEIKETNICHDLKIGSEVDFVLQIQLQECPENEDIIMPITVSNGIDILSLDIETQCHCNCSDSNKQSPKCNNNGKEVCGLCKCDEGFEGKKCQCKSEDEHYDEDNDDIFCRQYNTSEICSGNGICKCAKCHCKNETMITGDYCQCDKSECIKKPCSESSCSVCSGHGECLCGDCKCHEEYRGEYCECRTDNACISPDSSEKGICSGKGDCLCGRCKCYKTAGVLYTGKYCEDCSTCKSGKCNKFHHCVQCQQFSSGVYADNNTCSEMCADKHHIYETNSLQEKIKNGANECEFTDETNGCVFRFSYKYIHNSTVEYEIYALKEPFCPEKIPILYISFGLVGVIVLIGALTLIIWKITVILHYKKEFRDFEKKQHDHDGLENQNPLFKPSEKTYPNPISSRAVQNEQNVF